jgi:hypothetical protein
MSTDTSAHVGFGYAAGPITKAPEWHGLVAWVMLFNNLTSGLFLTAALSELAAPEVFTPVAKAAYPIAMVLLVADVVCLVLDLGDPIRFHHMLRILKPTSSMSLGTWCLTVYSLPLTVAAALSLLSAGGPTLEWVRKGAVVLGLLSALGSAVYKGVLFSNTAQPGWRDVRWRGGYLTNSALMLGCAELLTLSILMDQTSATAVLRPALILLLVFNVVALGLVAAELRPTLSLVHTRKQLVRLAVLCIGGGIVVPLGPLLAGGSALTVLAAVLFLLLGSLALRFVIVHVPHAAG